MVLQKGDLVGDRYEVKELLGRGGSAAVYLVTDRHIRKDRALKLISKSAAKDSALNPGMETELLGKLSHPYLPELIDVIESESDLAIVMNFIEGRTLSDVLRSEGAQSEQDVARWGIQLAEVLSYLHTLSPPVIYRDMKPGNIMLRPDGNITLLDFGIASQSPDAERSKEVQLGTWGYAAPEQLSGGVVDARTDLYGLGVTLFQLLTGVKSSELNCPLPPLEEKTTSIRKEWSGIVAACTCQDPDKRYGSAGELMQQLILLHRMIQAKDERLFGRSMRAFSMRHDPHKRGVFGKYTGERIRAMGRKERKKIMAIGMAVFGGIAGIVLAISGRAAAREELGRSYQEMLLEADAIVQTSFHEERYISEAAKKYAQAADLIPSREDAYLHLLDYCVQMGRTSAGLSAVCFRIDSGSGGIDHSTSVLFRVAELFFSGNPLDENFHTDYRKAAKYFAMIDRMEMPEAVYYASVAEALSTSSKKKDWRHISQMLAAFEEYNEQVDAFEKRIRNRILTAGVYTANRHAFQAAGINAYEAPIRLLEAARQDLDECEQELEADVIVLSPGENVKELRQQILRNLAAAYTAAAVSGEEAGSLKEALRSYQQLLDLAEDEAEKEQLKEQMENVERVSDYLKEAKE